MILKHLKAVTLAVCIVSPLMPALYVRYVEGPQKLDEQVELGCITDSECEQHHKRPTIVQLREYNTYNWSDYRPLQRR